MKNSRPNTSNFTRQNRHYRNTKATGLFGNIGIECLVRFEVNFFHIHHRFGTTTVVESTMVVTVGWLPPGV